MFFQEVVFTPTKTPKALSPISWIMLKVGISADLQISKPGYVQEITKLSPRMLPKIVFYLAVVPAYRKYCVETLFTDTDVDISIFAGDSHLDPTVQTGLPELYVGRVRNRRLIRDRILVVAGMDVADAGLKWTGWSFAAGWKLRN